MSVVPTSRECSRKLPFVQAPISVAMSLVVCANTGPDAAAKPENRDPPQNVSQRDYRLATRECEAGKISSRVLTCRSEARKVVASVNLLIEAGDQAR